MPEIEVQPGTQPGAGTGAGQPAGGTPAPGVAGAADGGGNAFVMPEKFTGKSAEDIARSYVELEKGFGSSRELQKRIDEFGGADTVFGWVDWVRQNYDRLQTLLVNGNPTEPTRPNPQPTTDPGQVEKFWESFELMAPREQYQTLAGLVSQAAAQHIQNLVAQERAGVMTQLEAWQGQHHQMLDIMQRALEAKIQNPKLDIREIYNGMLQMTRQTPEQLMKHAMSSLTKDADMEREIQTRVQQALLEADTKRKNAEMAGLFNTGNAPFKTDLPNPAISREQENAQILRGLVNDGTLLSSNL